MRITTPARSRALSALTLLAVLLAAGCDGSLIASESTRLDAPAYERGDVLYQLAPLDDGDTFTATLRLQDGTDLVLRTEGTEGRAVTRLDTGRLRVDSVTVEYLSDGLPMAPTRTIERGGFFSAGGDDSGDSSGDPPTSYHYEYRNGQVVIVQDYAASLEVPTSDQKQYLGTRGATLRLADGAEVPVTHLRYTLHTPEPVAAPDVVMFDASVAFDLRQTSLQ